jgi:hypothetical protein
VCVSNLFDSGLDKSPLVSLPLALRHGRCAVRVPAGRDTDLRSGEVYIVRFVPLRAAR